MHVNETSAGVGHNTRTMATIEERCTTLRRVAAEVVTGHGEFVKKTFLTPVQVCVSSSLQVLVDATFLVYVATVQIEPVSADTGQTPPSVGNDLELLTRLHTATELGGTKAHRRWKAAEAGEAAVFVGLKREERYFAFVTCTSYEHAVNETTRATRTFPGLDATTVHTVMVCPAGATSSPAECMNGCTIWRVGLR